jgi:lysophospholipase L1-like esterase
MIDSGFDGTNATVGAWITSLAPLAIVAAAAGLGVRMRPRWRMGLLLLCSFVTLRVLLFGNPLVWQFYHQRLDAEQIGWRQASVIRHQLDRFVDPGPERAYLALGSSQTDRIYSEYALTHDELDVFVLAGMSPLDLYLSRSAIDRIGHRTALLYLSELDLARRPPPEAIVTSPAQGLDLWRTWSAVRALPDAGRYRRAFVDLAVGEVLPEYKYGFVLRGAWNEMLRKVSRAVGRPDPPRARASHEQMVAWLRESFDEDAFGINLLFLDRYLAHANARGVEVVIAEGAYRPMVRTPELDRLAARARAELHALADRHPAVRFLERSEILDFADEDFDDLTHLNFESGRRFVHHLLARVEDRPPAADYSPAADPLRREVPGWTERMREQERELRTVSGARLVFLGDSLTEGWLGEGRTAWERSFAPYGAVNLGIGGDRTEHLLWRLRRTALEAARPEVAVLLIGSNNTVRPGQGAGDIVRGITENVAELRRRWPDTAILVLALLPRAEPGDDIRTKLEAVNAALAATALGHDVHLDDFGDLFLRADGRTDPARMPDGLHLSAAGYAEFAAALQPRIEALLDRDTGRRARDR